ncbi:tail fiber domain-containing protein [Micavibrio aeruginosavorus]|uniref:tail fiber domain-containing protein n=1 Tax=Micavibrio aeruginosavorus TaxID=349221 RepID=UPI003F4AD7D2
MTSQRNSERGNIFAALFGAVALIGVVGAASTALMRGPLSTVVTVNQKAKADTQMQLAAKLAVMEAAQQSAGGDCDGDGFIEPLVPRAGTTVPTNGGLIPGIIGATKTDPWGTEYGYCAWDMMDLGHASCDATPPGLLDGATADPDDARAAIIISIISAGPDRAFNTSCVDYATDPKMVLSGGDDVVHSFTYDDASGMSDGLWKLMPNRPGVATIDKEIELSKAASFLSETNFQGGAKFDSGFLDMRGAANSGLFLPNQSTSGACNAANVGVLRIFEGAGDEQTLQICDQSVAALALFPDGWVNVGGSGASGGEIDALTDGLRDEATGNLFLGTDDGDLDVDVAQADSNVVVGVGAGDLIVGGDENILIGRDAGNTLVSGSRNIIIGHNEDAAADSTNDFMNIGGLLYGDLSSNEIGIGVTNPTATLDVGTGTVNADRYQIGTNIFYDNGGAGELLLGTGGSTRLVIDAAGLVGIGMSSGGRELEVAGDILATENVYADFFYGTAGTAGGPTYSFDGDNDTGLFSAGANTVAIATAGGQRLVVDATGNVGIGEPTPGQALDVVGNGEFSGYVLGESFRVNSDSGLYEQGTGLSLNAGGSPALTVLATGEVGVGTTNPNMEFEVAGAIRLGDTSNGCAAGTAGSIKYTSGDALEYCSSDGNWYELAAGGGGGGGVGSPRISALLEAAAANTIDNANYAQTWNWDSLTTGNGLTLGSSSYTSGSILNVVGTNDSASGAALNASSTSTSAGSSAIKGLATGASGLVTGVIGQSDGGSGRGVYGYASATVGVNYGVQAISNGSNGYGLFARAASATGVTYGVYGDVNSPDGVAGYFQNLAGGWGLYSENDVGIGADHYLNWGTTRGDTGYGIRDNNGIMEIKNSSGTWSPISSSGSVGGAPGADTQVVYNSAGTLGADANFTWDRTTARLGLGVASPSGRLQTGDTIYDSAVCPGGYVAGDFDGEADVQDCVSIGMTVLPDGNVGIGTTSVAPFGGTTRTLMVSGTNSGDTANVVLRGHPSAVDETLGGIIFMNGANLGAGVSSVLGSSADSAGLIFNTWNAGAGQVPMWIQPDGRISLGSYVAADLDLRLDVNGKVGATEYCDEAGLNCIDIANVSGAGGADTEVQFNSSGTLAGSPGFTWTEGSSALNVTGRVNVSDRINIAGQAGSVPQLMRFGDLTDVDTTGAVNGNAIIFDGTDWVVGTIGSGSVGAAGADRQVQFNSSGSLAADTNFVYTSAGDFIVGSSQMDDGAGSDMRMFFNKTKGAFRAGYAGSDEWDDASVGLASIALGDSVTASGNSSFAAGNGTAATAEGSVALGSYAAATGNFAFAAGRNSVAGGLASAAFGFNTNASGQTSIAFGSSVAAGNGVAGSGLGDGSVAYGLIDDAVTITTPSQVTGVQSMGIFMGDQDGLVVSANNQMSLLGGKMVIDPRVPASNLSADTAFEVEGTIKISYSNEACDASREGSIRYMSSTDTFEVCAETASGWEEIGGNIEQVAGDPPVSNFVEDLDDLGDVTIASAVNGECLVYNGSVWADGACGVAGATPGGADTNVQFNSNGDLHGTADFTWNQGTTTLSVTGAVNVSDRINISGQAGNAPNRLVLNGMDDVAISSAANGECLVYNGAAWVDGACTASTPSAAGADRQIQFNSGNAFAADANFVYTAAGDFIVGSTQMDDTTTGNEDMRMFFNRTKGAFRAGGAYDAEWDDANIGIASVALGDGPTASGEVSVAIGNAPIASGLGSVAIGTQAEAQGENSLALGPQTVASETNSVAIGNGSSSGAFGGFAIGDGAQIGGFGEGAIALGRGAIASEEGAVTLGRWAKSGALASSAVGGMTTATGRYSMALGSHVIAGDGAFVGDDELNQALDQTVGEGAMAIGLVSGASEGSMSNTYARVTGDQSLGIFMGVQQAVDLQANNTMGLFGGKMVIDPRQQATNLSADTAFEVEGTIKIAYSGEACDASREGSIRYMSNTDTFEMCAVAANDWEAIGGGATPGGADTYVQFNSNGDLDGVAAFTWDNATSTLGVTGKINVSDRINIAGQAGNAPNEMTLANLGDVTLASPANGECLVYDGTTWENAACGGGGGAISDLTAATAANTLANADHTQTWNWDSLTTGNGLALGSSSLTTGNVLYVAATNTAASGSAIYATTSSTTNNGAAVEGVATGASGRTYGLYGTTNSAGTGAAGVFGWAYGASAATYGGNFGTDSTSGIGISAQATAATGSTMGGFFRTDSTGSAYGVYGEAAAGTGSTMGGYFDSASTSGIGVYGNAGASTGTTYGVYGNNASAAGYGGYFTNTNAGGGWGLYSTDDIGLAASMYLNWGATRGSTGYGIRDNAGVIECKNSGGAWAPCAGGGGGATPGGADTNVQFNSNGDLAGTADFTWDQASTTLSVSGVVSVGDKIAMGGVTGNLPTYLGLTGLSDVTLASPANGECLVYDGTTWENAACGGGGAISALTAATATNTINNLNFAQTWNWNTLTTQTALSMASTSMTSGTMLSVSSTNGTATGTGIYSSINTTGAAKAIYGRSWGTSGTASGVYGEAASASGFAVYGVNSAAGTGVYGTSTAASGTGVTGVANNTGGVGGVRGTTSSTSGVGIFGDNTAVSGSTSGVYGSAASATGFGVYGINAASAGIGVGGVANAGAGFGVLGITSSTTAGATGVRGNSTGTSGGVYGVHGSSSSTAGAGVLGANSATSGSTAGVWGTAASSSGFGMYGNNTASGGTGVGGVANTGAGVAVWGSTTSTTATATGVRGTASGASGVTYGVYGSSSSSTGYGGYFTNLSTGVALHAQGDITYTGVLTDTSDIRLKTDIQQLDAQDVLARLDQIDTYSFRMRDDVSGQLELGVMAQEVEKVFPELVRTASDEMGTKSVNYTGFVAPLIEATKTLKAENDDLKAELASLKTEQTAMVSSIDDLRADMNGMKAHTGYGIGKAGFGAGMAAGIVVILGGLGLAFMWNNTGLRRRRRAE